MRSVRPPPKVVVPPRPPAHLFERDDGDEFMRRDAVNRNVGNYHADPPPGAAAPSRSEGSIMPDPLKQSNAMEFEKEVQRQMMLLEQEFQSKLEAQDNGKNDIAPDSSANGRDKERIDGYNNRQQPNHDVPPRQQQYIPPEIFQRMAPPHQHNYLPSDAVIDGYKNRPPYELQPQQPQHHYGEQRDMPRRKGGGVEHMYDLQGANQIGGVAGIMGEPIRRDGAVADDGARRSRHQQQPHLPRDTDLSPDSRRKGARGLGSMYQSDSEAKLQQESKARYSEQLAQQMQEQQQNKERELLQHRGLLDGRNDYDPSASPHRGGPIVKGAAKVDKKAEYQLALQQQMEEQRRRRADEQLQHRGLQRGLRDEQQYGHQPVGGASPPPKSDKKSEYRQALQQQMLQQQEQRAAEKLDHRGLRRGGQEPAYPQRQGLVQKNAGGYSGFPPGGQLPAPSNALLDDLYGAQPQSQAQNEQRRLPQQNNKGNGMVFGVNSMDAKALKKAKQEEYRRQLDEQAGSMPKNMPKRQLQRGEAAAPPEFNGRAVPSNHHRYPDYSSRPVPSEVQHYQKYVENAPMHNAYPPQREPEQAYGQRGGRDEELMFMLRKQQEQERKLKELEMEELELKRMEQELLMGKLPSYNAPVDFPVDRPGAYIRDGAGGAAMGMFDRPPQTDPLHYSPRRGAAPHGLSPGRHNAVDHRPNNHRAGGVASFPAESEEERQKQLKRKQQEEYRRNLEQQILETKERKKKEKKDLQNEEVALARFVEEEKAALSAGQAPRELPEHLRKYQEQQMVQPNNEGKPSPSSQEQHVQSSPTRFPNRRAPPGGETNAEMWSPNNAGGGGPAVKWRPSAGEADDKRKQAIISQRAALDDQRREVQRRKEQEREQRRLEDEREDQRIRAELAQIEEMNRKEKEEKRAKAAESARELTELQDRKAEEAKKRKGKAAVTVARDADVGDLNNHMERNSRPHSTHQKPEYEPTRNSARDSVAGGGYDASDGYQHINSPLRDMLMMQQLQQQPQMPFQVPPQYGMAPQVQNSLAQDPMKGQPRLSADAVDRFVQNYQQQNPPQLSNSPLRGPYDPRYNLPPHAAYAPYHMQHLPPNQQSPPRENYGIYPQYGHPPQMAGYHPSNQQDMYAGPGQNLSFVSESRLLPANPWSSSDIMSSFVPLGANGRHRQQEQHPSGTNGVHDGGALEQSLASNSMLMYLGRQTPSDGSRQTQSRNGRKTGDNAHPRDTVPVEQPEEKAIESHSLSKLISETNEMVNREAAHTAEQQHEVGIDSDLRPAPLQVRSNSRGGSRSGHPDRGIDDRTPPNRIIAGAGRNRSGRYADDDNAVNVGAEVSYHEFRLGEDESPPRNRIFKRSPTGTSRAEEKEKEKNGPEEEIVSPSMQLSVDGKEKITTPPDSPKVSESPVVAAADVSHETRDDKVPAADHLMPQRSLRIGSVMDSLDIQRRQIFVPTPTPQEDPSFKFEEQLVTSSNVVSPRKKPSPFHSDLHMELMHQHYPKDDDDDLGSIKSPIGEYSSQHSQASMMTETEYQSTKFSRPSSSGMNSHPSSIAMHDPVPLRPNSGIAESSVSGGGSLVDSPMEVLTAKEPPHQYEDSDDDLASIKLPQGGGSLGESAENSIISGMNSRPTTSGSRNLHPPNVVDSTLDPFTKTPSKQEHSSQLPQSGIIPDVTGREDEDLSSIKMPLGDHSSVPSSLTHSRVSTADSKSRRSRLSLVSNDIHTNSGDVLTSITVVDHETSSRPTTGKALSRPTTGCSGIAQYVPRPSSSERPKTNSSRPPTGSRRSSYEDKRTELTSAQYDVEAGVSLSPSTPGSSSRRPRSGAGSIGDSRGIGSVRSTSRPSSSRSRPLSSQASAVVGDDRAPPVSEYVPSRLSSSTRRQPSRDGIVDVRSDSVADNGDPIDGRVRSTSRPSSSRSRPLSSQASTVVDDDRAPPVSEYVPSRPSSSTRRQPSRDGIVDVRSDSVADNGDHLEINDMKREIMDSAPSRTNSSSRPNSSTRKQAVENVATCASSLDNVSGHDTDIVEDSGYIPSRPSSTKSSRRPQSNQSNRSHRINSAENVDADKPSSFAVDQPSSSRPESGRSHGEKPITPPTGSVEDTNVPSRPSSSKRRDSFAATETKVNTTAVVETDVDEESVDRPDNGDDHDDLDSIAERSRNDSSIASSEKSPLNSARGHQDEP